MPVVEVFSEMRENTGLMAASGAAGPTLMNVSDDCCDAPGPGQALSAGVCI